MGKDADHAGTALYFPVEPFNMIECPAEPPESRGKAMTDVALPNRANPGFPGIFPAVREGLSRFFFGGFVLSSVRHLRQPVPGTQSGTSRALNYAALAVRKGKEPVSGLFLNLST